MFKHIIDRWKDRYLRHDEAVIISCYFNPMNSPYRLAAFMRWFDSIKHLNYHIIECVIGDAKPQLIPHKKDGQVIESVNTESLLWHKETLLNTIVKKLPNKYKYVFWIDADVLFTNSRWLVDGVNQLKVSNIIQPFEFCIHLEKGELEPSFKVEPLKSLHNNIRLRKSTMWRGFCANFSDKNGCDESNNYDIHGHVGFVWAAKLSVLKSVPLYDKALIGGADHIIAHAAAGQIPHKCIDKSFSDDLPRVYEWSNRFHKVVKGKIGYVKGELYHIWHGDIDKRQYLKRIQEFTEPSKGIRLKDENGLYVTKKKENKAYMERYFRNREVVAPRPSSVCNHDNGDDGFMTSMLWGYITDSTLIGTVVGRNPMGALLGDMLNNSDDRSNSHRHDSDTPIVVPMNNDGGIDPQPHHNNTNDLNNIQLERPLDNDNSPQHHEANNAVAEVDSNSNFS